MTQGQPNSIVLGDTDVYNLYKDIPSGAYMLRLKDFQEVVSIQATVFTPGFNFVISKILPQLFQMHPEEFDGDPTIIPLPQEIPLSVPRIILKDKNESKKLEVAPERVNYFRMKANADDLIVIDEFFESGSNLLNLYLEKTNANVGRIAAVIKRFSYQDNPAIEIASHFCKERFTVKPFNAPSNFEIHAHKKYIFMESFEVNSWVRVKSAKLTIKPDNKVSNGIIVEQDINTLSELVETKTYTNDEIIFFFHNILPEFDRILSLYFPE